MNARFVALLVLSLTIVLAPAATADADGGERGGECVWTSSTSGRPSAGVNASNCVDNGETADGSSASLLAI